MGWNYAGIKSMIRKYKFKDLLKLKYQINKNWELCKIKCVNEQLRMQKAVQCFDTPEKTICIYFVLFFRRVRSDFCPQTKICFFLNSINCIFAKFFWYFICRFACFWPLLSYFLFIQVRLKLWGFLK